MNHDRGWSLGIRGAKVGLRKLVSGAMGFVLIGTVWTSARAQQAGSAPATLVFDGVTVVDVEAGKLLPDQRVVIAGGRIQAVGSNKSVPIPSNARVVAASGRYLIPGLWDMDTHESLDDITADYAAFLADGITGVRDMAGHSVRHFVQWRQQLAANLRPHPRVLATGYGLAGVDTVNTRYVDGEVVARVLSSGPSELGGGMVSIHFPTLVGLATPAIAQHVVDSLKAIGVDFIKVQYELTREVYLAVAAEARRVGLPLLGPHQYDAVTEIEASDSGQRSLDHLAGLRHPCLATARSAAPLIFTSGLMVLLGDRDTMAAPLQSVKDKECRALAARFVQNGTWVTPALVAGASIPVQHEREMEAVRKLHRFGIPLLAGTDGGDLFADPCRCRIQDELALLVEAGLTPLEALQTATLNPAKFLRATDSLGTVAPGKLADLVLLDANPLADIANTRKVGAVVANGHYLDRAALDGLLAGGPPKAP